MLPIQCGLELTFQPNRRGKYGKEFRCKQEAEEVAAALNARLSEHEWVKDLAHRLGIQPEALFKAKADSFRVKWCVDTKQPHDSWCVEVGTHPLNVWSIMNGSPTWIEALQAVYSRAESLGLYPHVEQVARNGTVKDWPTGGGHIHVSTKLWEQGDRALLNLYLLEKMLCLSFVNRPFLRHLFAQWSDNINSRTAVPLDIANVIARERRHKAYGRSQLADWAHNEALQCQSIVQRFSDNHSGKPQYATWELRWFDMPRTVNELRLQVGFVDAWLRHYGMQIDQLRQAKGAEHDRLARKWSKECVTYTLTPAYIRKLQRDLSFARAEVEGFMRTIWVDPEPLLNAFWERSYVRRARHGKWA